MKITDIVVSLIGAPFAGPSFPPGDRQAQQLDIYPEFNQRVSAAQPAAGETVEGMYVEVKTDGGLSGLWGPIQDFQVFFVLRQLRPLLVGRDPLAIEQVHDQMVRMDRHGRSGMYMTAVSAIDCALWDLKGKVWGQPVYRLLGGPTRDKVPAYASMLGFSVMPEEAAKSAKAYQEQGYAAQKWFFRYGPGDGEEGKAKNLAMAQAVRSAVGEDYRLMFDAFMGWSTSYAIEMARALEPVRPFWLEEPVPPERIGALRKIRQSSRVPIATGEHVYTRWQTKELLVGEAVDVLQNDPDWTGGITEMVKICALASAFEVPVVAHGHSLLPALHVAASQSPATVPYVEFLIRYQEVKQSLHGTIYRPEQGSVRLPDGPGLGLTLDEAKITKRERVEM